MPDSLLFEGHRLEPSEQVHKMLFVRKVNAPHIGKGTVPVARARETVYDLNLLEIRRMASREPIDADEYPPASEATVDTVQATNDVCGCVVRD